MSFDVILDVKDVSLWLACAHIIFNPLYWNCVARYEYKTRRISKTIGSPRLAVIIFGATIFSLGLLRSWRFQAAVDSQPMWPLLQNDYCSYLGCFLVAVGASFVVTSFWRLGFFGTFCGDYFGIFLDGVVKGFPYNVVDNPMYVGSTMNYFGSALISSSQAGLFLSLLIAFAYFVATRFEEPFTAMVYKNRRKGVKNSKKKE